MSFVKLPILLNTRPTCFGGLNLSMMMRHILVIDLT